jgi:hypothetical protein
MPLYKYQCEAGHEFEQLWLRSDDATVHIHSSPCTAEGCGFVAKRTFAGAPAAAKFVGLFPGKRIKEVSARKSRLESRVDDKVKKGELTKQDVKRMADIRDKYAKASPYLTDTQKLKESQDEATKRQREEDQKPFHHELEM